VLLSVIARVATKIRWKGGLKVTVIVQLIPEATLFPQVLVCEYAAAPVPVKAMPEMLSAVAPVLVNVIVKVLDPPNRVFTLPKFKM
jgi:hypothetical protein